jgi:hypothetical protein
LTLPKRRQWAVATLYLVTGAIYVPYWAYRTHQSIGGKNRAYRGMLYLGMAAASWIAFAVTVLYVDLTPPAPRSAYLALGAILLGLAIMLLFALSLVEIARELQHADPEIRPSFTAIVVLTFCSVLSIFYVQHLINRTDPAAWRAYADNHGNAG